MNAFSANPIAYIVPAVLLAAVGLYYVYGAIDQVGLDVQTAEAVVTAKTASPGANTYRTNIAGGRAWTQSQRTPDTYALSLTINGEPTVGLVSREVFDSTAVNDRLRVSISRTRLSHRLEVVGVGR